MTECFHYACRHIRELELRYSATLVHSEGELKQMLLYEADHVHERKVECKMLVPTRSVDEHQNAV